VFTHAFTATLTEVRLPPVQDAGRENSKFWATLDLTPDYILLESHLVAPISLALSDAGFTLICLKSLEVDGVSTCKLNVVFKPDMTQRAPCDLMYVLRKEGGVRDGTLFGWPYVYARVLKKKKRKKKGGTNYIRGSVVTARRGRYSPPSSR
jgi:hypothetical protein